MGGLNLINSIGDKINERLLNYEFITDESPVWRQSQTLPVSCLKQLFEFCKRTFLPLLHRTHSQTHFFLVPETVG